MNVLCMTSLQLNQKHTASLMTPSKLRKVTSQTENIELKSIIISVIILIYLQVSHKIHFQALFCLTFTSAIFSSSLKKKMLRATQMIRQRISMVIMLSLLLKTQKQRENFNKFSMNYLKFNPGRSQLLLTSKAERLLLQSKTLLLKIVLKNCQEF